MYQFLRPAWAIVAMSLGLPAGMTASVVAGKAFTAGVPFDDYALPLGIAMASLAAVLFGVWGWLRRRSFDRTVERPEPDPNGSWMRLFGEIIDTVRGLPDDVLARLQTRYDGADNPDRINAAEERAWRMADWYSRIHTHDDDAPTRAQAMLAALWEESVGAYLAALAITVRDVISVDDFEALTEAWVAEGLPLPGGPAMQHMTLRLEVPSGLPGQWTKIDEATIEGDGTAAAAFQLAESLADHALSSPNIHDALPAWRIRVWAGLNADTDQPADGEYLRDARSLAEALS